MRLCLGKEWISQKNIGERREERVVVEYGVKYEESQWRGVKGVRAR